MATEPNVIVDGAPTPKPRCSRSHWPHSPVPTGLEADLWAQMAFGYLARPDLHATADIVSNQDGLVSVLALVSYAQPVLVSANGNRPSACRTSYLPPSSSRY